MINHVRTLLLNQAKSESFNSDFPGEEYVPLGFAPITLTPELARVRDILFGQNPDRAMLNYRLRQYMPLLHNDSFLDSYTKALDSRLTYLPIEDTKLVKPSVYGVNVTYLPVERTIFINGDVTSLRAISRLRTVWTLEILSSTTAKVIRTTTPTDETTATFSTINGLTSAIELTGSALTVYLDPTVGSKWIVETFARPANSLVDVVTRLEQLDNTTLTSIFGRGSEPFSSFQKMWANPRALGVLQRLGSFVLAYAYRLEERRQNRD